MYARDTNVRPHSEAACRVGRETLVPGGGHRQVPPDTPAAETVEAGDCVPRLSHARVRRAVITP